MEAETAMKKGSLAKAAFTLIELAAVIGIMVILLGIALPMVGKVGLGSQTRATANAVHSMLTTAATLARASGKIYLLDFDLEHKQYGSAWAMDFSRAVRVRTTSLGSAGRYQVNQMRLYAVHWHEPNPPVPSDPPRVVYRFAGDTYEVPSAVLVTLNDQVNQGYDPGVANRSTRTDHIYFKPDGSIQAFSGLASRADILIFNRENQNQRYRLDIDQYSGRIIFRDFRQEDVRVD